MLPLPWIKNSVLFCILTIAPLLIVQNVAPTVHFTDLVSIVDSQIFLKSIVTTFVYTSATFGNTSWQSAGWPWWPVVPLFSRRYCEYPHLRIIFDFNGLDMVQIFKSMLMVINWYKTEIAQYFHKWCFFHICYQRETVNRKGILWVKVSEGTAMPCEPHGTPNAAWAKSPSKCYKNQPTTPCDNMVPASRTLPWTCTGNPIWMRVFGPYKNHDI